MEIRIGNRMVGDGHPCYLVAEIGINHNGSLRIAERLIEEAAIAGFDAVKFQKRTIEAVYSDEELARPRATPYGQTNGDLKRRLEFDRWQFEHLDGVCRDVGVAWFASPWDVASAEMLGSFSLSAIKIASAMLTDHALLRTCARYGCPLIVSTGGSTLEQIQDALKTVHGAPVILLHCNASYPAHDPELNLRCIQTLRKTFWVLVGYSGHEVGLAATVAAVALGACLVERHVTLHRDMFGSDQKSSIEPAGMRRLVRDIRAVEAALGDGVKRVYPAEVEVMKKLRRKWSEQASTATA